MIGSEHLSMPRYVTAFKTHVRFSASILLVIMTLSGILYTTSEKTFTTCDYNPYRRMTNPDYSGVALIHRNVREFFFFASVYMVQLVTFVIMLFRFKDRRGLVVLMFLMYAFLYVPGWFMVETLKNRSGDRECRPDGENNGNYNGWSGHWYYIMYQFLTVHYTSLLLLGPEPTDAKKASPFAFVYLLLPIYTSAALLLTGFTTWVYGYHSLQQCSLGAIFGIAYSTFVIFAVVQVVPNSLYIPTKRT
eukprot:CFRG2680T1